MSKQNPPGSLPEARAKKTRQEQIRGVYIPASIMGQTELTLTQKVLWGRIESLSTNEGYCYASNDWLGGQIGLSKSTISNNISILTRLGYLARKVIRDEKGEIVERRLYPMPSHLALKKSIPTTEKSDTPATADSEESTKGLSKGVEKDKTLEPPKTGVSAGSKTGSTKTDPPEQKKGDMVRVTKTYKKLKGVEPKGDEWLPIQKTIRLMFNSGRTADEIIACMTAFTKAGKNGVEWVQNWTINTIRLKMAEFVAGKLVLESKKQRAGAYARSILAEEED